MGGYPNSKFNIWYAVWDADVNQNLMVMTLLWFVTLYSMVLSFDGNFRLEKVWMQLCFTSKIVSEYDQEKTLSQTADKPMALWGRATQQSRDTRKTNKAKLICKMSLTMISLKWIYWYFLCLVVNSIMVYSYGFFYNCTMVGQASDSMMALT